MRTNGDISGASKKDVNMLKNQCLTPAVWVKEINLPDSSWLEARLVGSSQTEWGGSQHSWVWASPPHWRAGALVWYPHQPSWSGEVRKLRRTCCYECTAASLLFVCSFLSIERSLQVTYSHQCCPSNERGFPHGLSCGNLYDTRIRGGTLPALIPIYFQHALINRVWGQGKQWHGPSPSLGFRSSLPQVLHGYCHHTSVKPLALLVISPHIFMVFCCYPVHKILPLDTRSSHWSKQLEKDQSCALIFWGFLLGTAGILQLSPHEHS